MKCEDCNQEMLGPNTDSCTCDVLEVDDDGSVYYHRSRYHFPEPIGRCHDCGIKHGGVHHWGCDVERCPHCGGQIISCDCLIVQAMEESNVPQGTEIKDPVKPVIEAMVKEGEQYIRKEGGDQSDKMGSTGG